MSEEFEAVGTIVEGGLVAKAVDEEGRLLAAEGEIAGHCLNCGAAVTRGFCGNCGQPLHVHRSIGAFWHDILHGVLHFEGKFWRTLPLLAWKPGDLTRRYVHGERAKFISPMALFLFSVFMMFAVFSFLGDPFSSPDSNLADEAVSIGLVDQVEQIEDQIRTNTDELLLATGDDKIKLEKNILDLKKGRNMLANLTGEDSPYPEVSLGDGDTELGNLSPDDLKKIESGLEDIKDGNALTDGSLVSSGSSETDKWLRDAFQKVSSNPDLLIYKLQANGYKFAWLLIPISLPFVWLVTIGRRGFRFYDHAVFTTYSISFMSLLFITCAILAAVGVAQPIWSILAIFYPPFHMYRQLRHAYGLNRIEALFRLTALLMFTVISLLLFFLILLALGVLG
ncbi:DUF3667 domain-containing protein [Parasphingorhabdus sp.]|jgi:hypothetical protein|uniref:DUF3667 domain-containing protein n=1 Tax=Parasphingorhabdus sp. TaxID=2709688 RepID=UPI003D2866F7